MSVDRGESEVFVTDSDSKEMDALRPPAEKLEALHNLFPHDWPVP